MGGETIFGKSRQYSGNTLPVTLSRTVSEINAFLRFMQKFMMATKMAGKFLRRVASTLTR